MKKAIFLYNPFAGNRSIIQKIDYIIKIFQKNNILVQPFRIDFKSEEMLFKVIQDNKWDLAILSGGDGTLNELTNAILKNNPNLPIGIFPSGTCNDFARSLELPHNLTKAIDIIIKGKIEEVDVGIINEEKFFLSSCAGGLFVDVSYKTNTELKKNLGPLAYYLTGFGEMAKIDSFKIKLDSDMGLIQENVLLFIILNGKHAAGFNNIIREAEMTDGIMDIMLIRKCSHIDIANIFYRIISQKPIRDKNVIYLKTTQCSIESNRYINLSIDGEKGGALPIKVRFIKEALKVFVK